MNALEIGEIWYQRTHKLREVWQNKSVSETKRLKAYNLFLIMLKRVLFISSKINEIQSEINSNKNFELGGYSGLNHLS